MKARDASASKNTHCTKTIWCDAQYRHLETELTEPPDLGLVGVEAEEGEPGELVDTLLWVGGGNIDQQSGSQWTMSSGKEQGFAGLGVFS